MRALAATAALCLLAFALHAAEPAYPPELAAWQEAPMPGRADEGARTAWLSAANRSPYEWRVFAMQGQARVERIHGERRSVGARPAFRPSAGRLSRVSAHANVDDGWLVGFNEGEFGAALYWFSPDGRNSYKVSDHQVVDFYTARGSLHAIEGLSHLGLSRGSVIRIERQGPERRWRALQVQLLPSAPQAVSLRRDGTALITLSHSIVSLDQAGKLTSLHEEPMLDLLFVNSSVLAAGESKLYFGMRQYVGEYDLAARRFRVLLPSLAFLNRLP